MLKARNFNILANALKVLTLVVFFCAADSYAQSTREYHSGTSEKPSRNIMRAATNRTVNLTGRYGTDSAVAQKFSLPPLPGDQGFADTNDDPERFLREKGNLPDFGINQTNNANIVLPPLKGLRQILDSPVTTALLKNLTASEAAVLMQTYMMVENGAATGFMGSVNMGTNLMSNLLQTQDYQLKLLEASDDTGKMKKAYVARVAKEMQEGANKDVWPAALYIASGEDGEPAKPDQKMQDLKAGQKPYDILGLKPPNTGTSNSLLFTDVLFVNNPQTGGLTQQPYRNEQLDRLKQDFKELVGDIEIKMDPNVKSQYARKTLLNFIPPKLDTSNKRRGVAAVNWQEVQVTWENLHIILFEYCQWKASNPNKGKKVFEKETETTTKMIGKDQGQGNPWELASAPDIPMTMNVIQMLYRMYEQTKRGSDVRCDQLKLTASDIPDDESKAAGDANNLNDCSGGKGCLRNRIALQISYLVARSRTLHTYRALFTIASRFVTDEFTGDLFTQVSNRAFAGMDVDEELRANYARYGDFLGYMAELAQGNTGAGTFMKPGGNKGMHPGKT